MLKTRATHEPYAINNRTNTAAPFISYLVSYYSIRIRTIPDKHRLEQGMENPGLLGRWLIILNKYAG